MLIRTAQLAGGDNIADRVFVTGNAVIVLDGASAFEPVDVDPGIYAETLGASVAEQLDDNPEMDLSRAVAVGIQHTTATLHLCKDASPSSTVTILRTHREAVDLYALGDSPIYYGAGQTVQRFADDRLVTLPLAERTQYVDALRAGAGFNDEHRATLRRLQRTQRLYRNRAHGYWIAGCEPAAAGHALITAVPVEQIEWAVLATDGAADPIEHSSMLDWPEIAQLDESNLIKLLSRLNAWEAKCDPDGQQYPRGKRHDDKTLAVVPALARNALRSSKV